MKKITKLSLAALFVAFLHTSTQAQAVTLPEIQEKGSLVVGMNAEYPPFEWVQVVDGEATHLGIDVDLGQLIADELGVELVIDNRAFDSLIPSLQTNKIDVIISGMDHTPERAEQVAFSESYFNEISKFGVALGEAANYTEVADFTGKKIGVLMGSSQETYLKNEYPDLELVSLSKNGDMLEALKAKKVDAIFMSDLTLAQFLPNYASSTEIVEAIEIQNEGVGSAVAMTLENEGLKEAIDEIIQKAKEDGTMDEIFDKNVKLASENNPAGE